MVQVVLGVVLAGFLVALGLGLATGRIPWRQDGCCPADPARDLRMRGHDERDRQHHTAPHDV